MIITEKKITRAPRAKKEVVKHNYDVKVIPLTGRVTINKSLILEGTNQILFCIGANESDYGLDPNGRRVPLEGKLLIVYLTGNEPIKGFTLYENSIINRRVTDMISENFNFPKGIYERYVKDKKGVVLMASDGVTPLTQNEELVSTGTFRVEGDLLDIEHLFTNTNGTITAQVLELVETLPPPPDRLTRNRKEVLETAE